MELCIFHLFFKLFQLCFNSICPCIAQVIGGIHFNKPCHSIFIKAYKSVNHFARFEPVHDLQLLCVDIVKLIVITLLNIFTVQLGDSLYIFGLSELCGSTAVNIKISKLSLALVVKACVRDIHAFYRCGVGNICADAEALSYLYKQERTCCHEMVITYAAMPFRICPKPLLRTTWNTR